MDPREFPTKGNLMLAKNSLKLAHQGYDLMDRKRNILLKELMGLIDLAKDIQDKIDSTFSRAYECLQKANIEHGISRVQDLGFTVPVEESLKITTRSIMGTEVPLVKYDSKDNELTYSLSYTHESIDLAREAFREVKDLTIKLATVETSAYRLATNIKKTQKRANALKNITIPMYNTLVFNITNALEEKDREEFTRLKVIKSQKAKKSS
ncbi:MAG: V-type ATP synthase subunit D [Lachnospiraceae bacterium]|jgi:V/A-type H+-transporting ATPase subunit D|nr:V-type ATP synthase subunit D [Lachnospiraceae bacterium]